MGFPWFKCYGAAVDHPKVIDLCALLEQPLADAYVLRLWAWCNRFRETGRFANGARSARAQVETAVRWSGEPGDLADALVRVGLLDEVAGDLVVHDWEEHQSAHIRKSEVDAERKRALRIARLAAVRAPTALPAPKRHAVGAGKTETETETETEREATTLSASQPTAPKAKKPADPRLKPLEALLVAAYADLRGEAYAHGGAKDVLALKALLPLADDAAIVARWRVGLEASGWSSCNTLAQLRAKWNDLAAGSAPAGAPKIPDVRKGMVRAEDQDWNHDHGIEDSF